MYHIRPIYPNELLHSGVKGQKWGVRRYQNYDGSLTPAGKERYINKQSIPKDLYVPANASKKYSKQISALLRNNPYEGDGKYRIHVGNNVIKLDSALVNSVVDQMNENPELLEQMANADPTKMDTDTIAAMTKAGEIATKSVATYRINKVKTEHKKSFDKAKSLCKSIIDEIRKVVIKVKNKITGLFIK